MNYSDIFDELVKEIRVIVSLTWSQSGVDNDSRVIKSINPVVKGTGIEVYAADYARFIDSGRKKFTKKIPISALILWIKRKKISPRGGLSINNLAYAIQNSIYQNGIKGKNIIEKGEKAIDGTIKPIIQKLVFEKIKKELKKLE